MRSASAPARRSPTCCRRSPRAGSSIRCVATSDATEEQARELGIAVEPFETLERLDIAIDGADQIAPDGWLVKGGGGAHTREKIVAAAAERFVVDRRLVEAGRARSPRRSRSSCCASGSPRPCGELGDAVGPRGRAARSPDGGVIADYWARSATRPSSPAGSRPIARRRRPRPLPPALVADVIVAGATRSSASRTRSSACEPPIASARSRASPRAAATRPAGIDAVAGAQLRQRVALLRPVTSQRTSARRRRAPGR